MPTRKVRIELSDGEGNKYTVAFEGQISREKALRLFDLVELLGGVPSNIETAAVSQTMAREGTSKCEKVRRLIQKQFPLVWFSSRDIQTAYEQEFKEPVSLSTVATYFARMEKKGLLLKTGSANRLRYKLAPSLPQAIIKQNMP